MKLAMVLKLLRNMSIKWKIFSVLIGFNIVLIVILWLFQGVFLDEFYKFVKIRQIKASAVAVEKNLGSDVLTDFLIDISNAYDVCLDIVTKNGVIYSVDTKKDCIIHRMSSLEKAWILSRTIENGGELLQRFDGGSFRLEKIDNKLLPKMPSKDFNPLDSIIYSKVMTNSNGESVAIIINSIISPVNATVKTLRIQIYWITAFMVVFSALVALVIAKWVSSPIEHLNEGAKHLAKGDYCTEFLGSGYREINELSDTLNFAAKELSKVEHLRRELIANISHDLRTPLTLISGYAEIMRDIPNENNPENAQIIVEETKRLTTLVNDVLDISKLQSGVQTLNMAAYNLTDSIKATIFRLNELVKSGGYEIDFEYDNDAYVVADETKLEQAFYNLLTNAINYTGENKKVVVRQSIHEGFVKIEVIDTGEGIEKENLPYIWDRYYKLDKNHKRAVTGTGLGLSIVREVIKQHGGNYGVQSKVGEGSVFWFAVKHDDENALSI